MVSTIRDQLVHGCVYLQRRRRASCPRLTTGIGKTPALLTSPRAVELA
jgi:hypothetical protein